LKTPEILNVLTVASPPDEPIQTIHGRIPYLEWLLKEQARLQRKSGWPVEIDENPQNGYVRLVLLRLRKIAGSEKGRRT
jgi:hypothetical protein